MQHKAELMDEAAVERALVRISHQIIEKNHGAERFMCADAPKIRGGGGMCGKTRHKRDITLYRDDLSRIQPDPRLNGTSVPFSVQDQTVVLVDDVIYTGRTARAALDAVMELGRAARIQLCVLIDRGHSELPIKATYVGKNIPTARDEIVSVRLAETDGQTDVSILRQEAPGEKQDK